MEYRQLGGSGLRVSPLCLGCMNFGASTTAKVASRIIHEAIEQGVNFLDTANVYGPGTSEEIVSKALEGKRDQVVLATKVASAVGDGPNDWGASRVHIMAQVEASLRRLKTDRIDLYQVHQLDLTTPIEETLQALDDLVRQGKVRYAGTSKWPPSLIGEAVRLAQWRGWSRIISEQPPYNLLDRTVENELIWTCQRHDVGIIPWGVMATGMLSGQYKLGEEPPTTSRRARGGIPDLRFTAEALDRVAALSNLAQEAGLLLPVFSLAWVLNRPGVTSALIGPRTLEQLRTALRALNISLSPDDHERIDTIAPPGTSVANYYDVNVTNQLLPKRPAE